MVAQVRWIGLGLAVFITLDVLLTHLGDAVSFVTLAVGVAVALLGPRLLPLLRPISEQCATPPRRPGYQRIGEAFAVQPSRP